MVILSLAACGGKGHKNPLDDGGTDGGTNNDGGETLGSVQGYLAYSEGVTFRSLASTLRKDGLEDPAFEGTLRDLSLDEVSVDLLRALPGENPESWPPVATATPDASGGFFFEDLAEGSYALRVRQPEFDAVAYGVDTTEFHLGAGETVRLVLPLISTVVHGLSDPVNSARTAPPLGVAAVPGSDHTILVGAQLSTSNVMVPFVKVVDGTGAVIADERARDYLGIAEDPEPGTAATPTGTTTSTALSAARARAAPWGCSAAREAAASPSTACSTPTAEPSRERFAGSSKASVASASRRGPCRAAPPAQDPGTAPMASAPLSAAPGPRARATSSTAPTASGSARGPATRTPTATQGTPA